MEKEKIQERINRLIKMIDVEKKKANVILTKIEDCILEIQSLKKQLDNE